MSLLVYNWWQWDRRWRPVEIVEVEFDLASDLSSNVHPCHLKGNTTVLADTKNKQSGYLLHSIIRISKGYALSRGYVITRVWRLCLKTCWSWDIIIFMISTMSIAPQESRRCWWEPQPRHRAPSPTPCFKYPQQRHNGSEDWVILPK